MRVLAPSEVRCNPEQPDQFCRRCARWLMLPGQGFNHRYEVVYGRENSLDPNCDFVSALIESDQ